MAVAIRGVRFNPGVINNGLFSFLSYRFFVFAMFSLLFLAALSFLHSSHSYVYTSSSDPVMTTTGNAFMHTTFLALNSDPLKTRLDLIQKQARDHVMLINAYAACARKLKLENAKQLSLFYDLAENFTNVVSKPEYTSALAIVKKKGEVEEDVLKHLEKEIKEKVKFTRLLIAESKESYDNQLKIQKLKDTVFAVQELLVKAKKNGAVASMIAAKSVPKSLHCLQLKLAEERISHPEKYKDEVTEPEFEDPTLYHYAIYSDNVIAVSVVVNSAVEHAAEPTKHVFHVVTEKMNVAAMKVWFKMRPVSKGAHVEVKSWQDFEFLAPQLDSDKDVNSMKIGLDHLRFYLPEMYPKLHRIFLLDDDVVVQKDLTALWSIDLDGKVNGAVETCFGSFHRYNQYLNFSNPLITEKFDPGTCAWAFGMNVFDLDAWRREKCTEKYHYWQNLDNDGSLWKPGTLPLGLITFYSTTKSLDKSWHVLGLGYNPSMSMDVIKNAAVVHYNGNMKPWLDIALNQYKELWTKYVDSEMEFVQMCNFGF